MIQKKKRKKKQGATVGVVGKNESVDIFQK